MLTLARQAYDEADVQLARDVAVLDHEVDTAEQEVNDLMFREMQDKPDQLKTCVYLTWITHSLERIADRCTNISEYVVYKFTNEMPELNQ